MIFFCFHYFYYIVSSHLFQCDVTKWMLLFGMWYYVMLCNVILYSIILSNAFSCYVMPFTFKIAWYNCICDRHTKYSIHIKLYLHTCFRENPTRCPHPWQLRALILKKTVLDVTFKSSALLILIVLWVWYGRIEVFSQPGHWYTFLPFRTQKMTQNPILRTKMIYLVKRNKSFNSRVFCCKICNDLTWPHWRIRISVEVEESIKISECNGRSGSYAWECYSDSYSSSLSFLPSLSLLFTDIHSFLSLSFSICLILSLFLSLPLSPLHSLPSTLPLYHRDSFHPWRLLISSHLTSHPTMILFSILPLPLPLPLQFLNIIQPSSVLLLLLNCDHRTKSVKEKKNETSSLYRNVMRILSVTLNQSCQAINSHLKSILLHQQK